jgi:hypothetical protein
VNDPAVWVAVVDGTWGRPRQRARRKYTSIGGIEIDLLRDSPLAVQLICANGREKKWGLMVGPVFSGWGGDSAVQTLNAHVLR